MEVHDGRPRVLDPPQDRQAVCRAARHRDGEQGSLVTFDEVHTGVAQRARGGGAVSLTKLRAIPWVFSWAQCRANVPGWYGLGTGLAKAAEHFEEAAFRNMFAEWYFMRALTADAEMVLQKLGLHYRVIELCTGDRRPNRMRRRIEDQNGGDRSFDVRYVALPDASCRRTVSHNLGDPT